MSTALAEDFMAEHDTLDAAVLQALQESSQAHSTASGRLEAVEEQVENLEASFHDRMGRLEGQMGTTNAHLDNIAREASITNDLLRQELEDRKTERKRQQEIEDEKRRNAREDKRANRDLLLNTGKELWSIFKQPLGYLVAAALAYAAFVWFGQERGSLPASAEPAAQIIETNPEGVTPGLDLP